MNGSVYLKQPPVPPDSHFTLLFGEVIRAVPGAMAYFLEQRPGPTRPEAPPWRCSSNS